MYKNSILIAALLTGAYASENPFVIEKNIQKIEQEESLLLQSLAKEQMRAEREEDKLSKEGISEAETADVKPEESSAPSEMEIAQEPEVRETKKEVEKSKPEEVTPSKAEAEEAITIREVTEKAEIKAASKPESSKKKPAIVDEVSAQPAAEENGSAESNATFEQELQEAIKSVQG